APSRAAVAIPCEMASAPAKPHLTPASLNVRSPLLRKATFFVASFGNKASSRRHSSPVNVARMRSHVSASITSHRWPVVTRTSSTFAQIAGYAGIEASDWSWDALFLDVDLDGYEDVLVTTGHLWDVMDADTWERIRATFTGLEWRRELALFPKLALKSVAYRNNGDLTFSDAGAKWGFAGEDAMSHGMATADLDGDGALDVVVNRLDGPAAMFQNLASAPRVAVRLRGRAPNTSGAGSKIRVLGGPVPVQQKEVVPGGTDLAGSDPLYTLAAGTAQELTIEVDWRRGGHTVIHGVKPNREYEITEPPGSPGLRPGSVAPPPRAEPWFRDVSAQLGHRHVETPFNDWARQPLLPQALSQLGPG